MKAFIRSSSPRLFALLAALFLAFAPVGAHAQAGYAFSQQELDQMLAPVALYPDPLLSQILIAATYPSEIAEAARWSRARPGLSGDDAVRAAEGEDWDDSVKSLIAFPQVLAHMDENPQWTQALGDAFLEQQSRVMDTVQALRRRAAAEGNLRSDDRIIVVENGPDLLLQPLDPQVVYVPYYDPQVVYGTWWWPAYRPMRLRPWSGYYARPAYPGGFYWGPPVGISAGFFFGTFDWTRRQVRVAPVNPRYYGHGQAVNRAAAANRTPGAWRHDPERRARVVHGGVAAPQRPGAPSTAPNQHDRAWPAAPRRSDLSVGAHPAGRTVTPPEAPAHGRPGDTRATVRPHAVAPITPAASPAAGSQSGAAESRFDHRRDRRATAPPPAPVPPAAPAPQAQTAPVARTLPPAPALRSPAAAAPPATIAPPARAVRADRPAAGPGPGAQRDERAGEPHRENRHSRGAPHQGAGAQPGGRPPTGR